MDYKDAKRIKDRHALDDEEFMEIQEEILVRQLADAALEQELRKRRAAELVGGRRRWSIPELQIFIRKINRFARDHNCLDKLPTEVFPSMAAFLEAAIPIMEEYGVPKEDIRSIFETHEELIKSQDPAHRPKDI